MKGNGVKIGWIWRKTKKGKKNTKTIKRRENSPVAQALLVIHARQTAVKRNFRILASLSESDLSSDGYVNDLLLHDIFILIISTIRKMCRRWRHVSLASLLYVAPYSASTFASLGWFLLGRLGDILSSKHVKIYTTATEIAPTTFTRFLSAFSRIFQIRIRRLFDASMREFIYLFFFSSFRS